MPHVKIILSGHLDPRWQSILDGCSLTHQFAEESNPITILEGNMPDQSAIYGCLTRLKNLGVSLRSLETTDVESK